MARFAPGKIHNVPFTLAPLTSPLKKRFQDWHVFKRRYICGQEGQPSDGFRQTTQCEVALGSVRTRASMAVRFDASYPSACLSSAMVSSLVDVMLCSFSSS